MARPKKTRARRRPRNTGSIVVKNGVLIARWYIDGRDAEGNPTKVQRERKLPKGSTPEEAERFLRGQLSARAVDDGGMVVSELLDHFLEDRQFGEQRVCASTIQGYRRLVRCQLVPHFGTQRLRDIEPGDVLALYTRLRQRGGVGGGPLGDATIKQAHAVLSGAFVLAIERGWMQNSPVAVLPKKRRPKVKRQVARVFSLDDLLHLISHTSGTRCFRCPDGDDRTDDQRAADALLGGAVALGGLAGLRRGEICAARWGDLDLARGVVSVRYSLEQVRPDPEKPTVVRLKPPKSGEPAAVEIGRMAVAVLTAAKTSIVARFGKDAARFDRYVLTLDGKGRVSPNVLSKHWAALVASLGLEGGLHALRHSFAAELLRAGAPVQEVQRLMRHSTVDLTVATYGHVGEEGGRHAADLLDGHLDGVIKARKGA